MGQVDVTLSTGNAGLDKVLGGLIPGDNIVWQIRKNELYVRYARSFAEAGLQRGRSVHWFSFTEEGSALVGPEIAGVNRHYLDVDQGFESFIGQVHDVIDEHGSDGWYIFDCLSDLTADWYSDAMLANFYMLTCPLVYDVGGLALFALVRHRHSSAATGPIFDTAQVVIDGYVHQQHTYLHPIKVQHRHSPTMHMLHQAVEDDLQPVLHSPIVADVLATAPSAEVGTARNRPDVWHQVFHNAERMLNEAREGQEPCPIPDEAVRERLLRMVLSRDERVLALVRRYFSVDNLLEIGHRCIGTGLIGGKSVGMLLARAIAQQEEPQFAHILEHHDSFFICSDVYYSFLVHNGIWWVHQRQRNSQTLLRDAKRARQRILTGTFPPEVVRQFERMLAYFGQSPIIARSSSLLEDNFGNAFAGKYESVFCVNQGMRDQRLRNFLSAIRTIYASAMSEDALRYRQSRGLLDRDEQMALLVQRVSGTMQGNYFYPHTAGVALSHNPFVWDEIIDPAAGMLRLVYGLGTRAVDRSDDDYTRLVALNAPQRSPESGESAAATSQQKADVLDLMGNQLVSVPVAELLAHTTGEPLRLLSSVDQGQRERARMRGRALTTPPRRRLDFAQLLRQPTGMIADMGKLLKVLETAYQHPVDVEFTVNFLDDGAHRIDLVQCRPLQFLGHSKVTPPPATIPSAQMLLQTPGPVIGQSRSVTIDEVIYIPAAAYAALSQRERYSVARLVGKALRGTPERGRVLLIGPGRWGTTTPSLGVPVNFNEIAQVEALCEVVDMGDGLTPDVSLGTHFFNDLVEEEILYIAHYPGREGHHFNAQALSKAPNRCLERLGASAEAYSHILRVIHADDILGHGPLNLFADCLQQQVLVWSAEASTNP